MKKLKINKLIENEVYYHSVYDEQYVYIFRYKQRESDNEIGYKPGFIDSLKRWDKSNGWNYGEGIIRKPTESELLWFLECEKQNRLVPQNEIIINNTHELWS